MKDKWKNIRDSFVKHEKQGKSGDPAAKKKKYIYADALSFLLQTLEKRKTSGNVEEEVDEEKHQEAVRNVEDDTEESHAASALSYVPQTKYRQRAKASITPFQNELLKKLSDTSKQDEMDVDKAFLFSLLPDYKQLNAADKFNFKIMNLQFFENIRRTKHTQNMQPGQTHYTTLPHFSPHPAQGPLHVLTPSQHMQISSPAQIPSPAQTPSPTETPFSVQTCSIQSPSPVQNQTPAQSEPKDTSYALTTFTHL